jgi:hypothetical protein
LPGGTDLTVGAQAINLPHRSRTAFIGDLYSVFVGKLKACPTYSRWAGFQVLSGLKRVICRARVIVFAPRSLL